jgi:hypothetical protein
MKMWYVGNSDIPLHMVLLRGKLRILYILFRLGEEADFRSKKLPLSTEPAFLPLAVRAFLVVL